MAKRERINLETAKKVIKALERESSRSPPQKAKFSLQDIVRNSSDKIATLRNNGYTWNDISKVFANNGVAISPTTLRAYAATCRPSRTTTAVPNAPPTDLDERQRETPAEAPRAVEPIFEGLSAELQDRMRKHARKLGRASEIKTEELAAVLKQQFGAMPVPEAGWQKCAEEVLKKIIETSE